MTQKKGITSMKEAFESRKNAIESGKLVKRKFKDLIPHRIDQSTVILLKSNKDKTEQIDRFIKKLERDRMNY